MASTRPLVKNTIDNPMPAARMAQLKIMAVSRTLRKQNHEMPNPMTADQPARRIRVLLPS
jgi:hypothetical protein